ncbi:LLM class flavin-dependent oxidoreductase [Rhodohalobacter sp. SW132]|uniref:LLM class flavin-dependent oxidoreductase n=1 Tax=Rhodohalobacter sp. SW132 TaxID=2293433 RepID=UPI000E278E4C|nr:LLM class flavin-dependent oxidoreductase [Rhodohalobacter sp. SW132]REL37798.1 LLM class flavin-dependent oxidoreductase [Rhodohalobacter sp. SW132]
MKSPKFPIPFSLLDLAVVTEGSTIAEVIERSRDLAIQTESFGYNRFWMAEHHNMENIASSATSILLGHVAEATQSIRVGSGGIMLPNHSPLIIAEQFGTLATMYPGRIDLGLGRAPGTDQVTAAAIREDRMQRVHKFPEHIKQLQNYLSAENSESAVRAIPGEGTDVPIWILGSSTDSAFLAAELGLPYAFASHFAPHQLLPATRIYRERFKPSAQLDRPYLMPGINVVVAETDEQAEYLATSMLQMFMGVVTGDRKPMPPPVDDMNRIWNMHQKAAVEQMLTYTFTGSIETVQRKVEQFIEITDADELMIASYLYDYRERVNSHKRFSELMQSISTSAESV